MVPWIPPTTPKMAGGGHMEFRNMLLKEDICTKFDTKMQHDHVGNNVVLSDYKTGP